MKDESLSQTMSKVLMRDKTEMHLKSKHMDTVVKVRGARGGAQPLPPASTLAEFGPPARI